MSELIGKTLGSYRITEEVGRGGMTTVYKGHHLYKDQLVAIKVLSSNLAHDPMVISRFRREAKVLHKLHHPHIIPILDYGEVNDRPYIVMPFVTAGTLRDRLRKGPLKPLEGARLMNQVSSALEFAHQNGVIHRDLKPSNIMLDSDGNALLTDFGIAHVFDLSQNLTGSALIGTPAYMSPEQVAGEPVGAQSDQYSLGVLLYQLATGQLPYIGDTPLSIAIKHLREPTPQPREISANLPELIEAVLLKSMEKDPTKRFSSVAKMNDAFQQALVESLDSAGMTRPKPEPHDDITVRFETLFDERRKVTEVKSWLIARRVALGIALIILIVFAWPLASRELFSVFPKDVRAGEEDSLTIPYAKQTELMATINALSTANATYLGPGIESGIVDTAVAETLAAMEVAPSEVEISDTPDQTQAVILGSTPTNVETVTNTLSITAGSSSTPSQPPTKTLTESLGPSPTPTDIPTSGPSPTQTIAGTVMLSDTPTPTSTITPTKTNTPTLTPTRTSTHTQTPKLVTMHVGDLDGYSTSLGNTWTATVTITIHDTNHNPIANANVSGEWNMGGLGTVGCVTSSDGTCSTTSDPIQKKDKEIIFFVNNVSHGSLTYTLTDNHDPDGDSNGTEIIIGKN